MSIVSPTRTIASAASRHVMYAGAGVATTMGIAFAAKTNLVDDDAAASEGGAGRVSNEEAKRIFSGTTGATTLLPLSAALMCIASLYLKNRALLGEAAEVAANGAKLAQNTTRLNAELRKVGVEIVANEGPKTKSLYTYLAGGIFGSALGSPFIFGGPPE